jgi:hypothetical protein
MTDQPCGCGSSPTPSDEYLLVKATGKNPNQCGDPASDAAAASCAKKEQMYDIALSDFLIPSESGTVLMTVCNASVYSVGSWLEFLNPIAKLKITSISGNIITLVNRCSGGGIVASNPPQGQVISKGTRFIVASAPECKDPSETYDDIIDALEKAKEICVPALVSSSTTATIQPVGRVVEDPDNISACKGIRRIFGILFKAGKPFLTALGGSVNANDLNYRPLVKHVTSNEVRVQKGYHESSGVLAGTRYVLGITNSTQKIVGPFYLNKFFDQFIEQIPTSAADVEKPNSWAQFTNQFTKEFTISSYPEIIAINNDASFDHYYINLKIDVGVNSGDFIPTYIEIESAGGLIKKCGLVADSTAYNVYNSMYTTVKILKSDNKFKFRMVKNGTTRYFYRLQIDGAYY